MRGDLPSVVRGTLIKTDLYFCRQRLLQTVINFDERRFDTTALLNVRIPFQGGHFSASLVVFLPEPQRGGPRNRLTSQPRLVLTPHFTVPAR